VAHGGSARGGGADHRLRFHGRAANRCSRPSGSNCCATSETIPGLSIRAIAVALERDYKRVHGDVTELEEWQLIECDENGKLSAPYDEIMIRAPLRDAA
jgi:hypothetical protein